MLSTATIISTVIILLLLRRLQVLSKWDHLPGPKALTSIPLLGHAYKLGTDPIASLIKFKKKYGPIFRMDLGPQPTVYICDYDLIVEASKLNAFSDRPFDKGTVPEIWGRNSKGKVASIILGNGELWREGRKFFMTTMKLLGFGNGNIMEDIINREINVFCRHLKEKRNRLDDMESHNSGCEEITVNMRGRFNILTNCVIWKFLTGKNNQQDDEKILKITAAVTDLQASQNPGNILNLLQSTNVWFCKLCQLLGIRNMIDTAAPMVKMMGEEVNSSKADKNGVFVDCWLEKVEQAEYSEDSPFYFKDGKGNLTRVLCDMFAAGTETSASFLEHAVRYMINYPDIQKRAFQEINFSIGQHNPSLHDRLRTPYVEAILEEIGRHSNLVPFGLPHYVSHGTTFHGHYIPSGTQILLGQSFVNFDPNHFHMPEVFCPERFLTEEGKFVPSDHVALFGYGKRRCAGETLAKSELYLVFVSLVQRFKMKRVHSDTGQVTGVKPGIIYIPLEFSAVFEPRF